VLYTMLPMTGTIAFVACTVNLLEFWTHENESSMVYITTTIFLPDLLACSLVYTYLLRSWDVSQSGKILKDKGSLTRGAREFRYVGRKRFLDPGLSRQSVARMPNEWWFDPKPKMKPKKVTSENDRTGTWIQRHGVIYAFENNLKDPQST
jgi:hypothetical protein